MRRALFWQSTLLAATVAAAGCGYEPSVGEESASIASEHAGGVAQAAPRLYTDPELTLTGYAVPDVGGCTGEMLGPNVMMTAAHCGDSDRFARFWTYRNQDPQQWIYEQFNCHILLNTFWRTDMTLHFCDPNSKGENPGDKYGYLDIDHSSLTVGQSVYSYWYNPIDSLSLGWALIYSTGKVTATNASVWGTSGDGPQNSPIGIATDLWTQPGASGSAILNPTNYRMIAGPTSTGVSDGAGRWMQSVKTDLEQGSVDGWKDGGTGTTLTGVHDTNLTSLGLTPSKYSGKLDKNGDYLFDVQQDAERIRGENNRDWYFLGFNSERRNALWDTAYTSFDTYNKNANINVTSPSLFGGWDVLVHRHLPIAASTRYRVSFMIYTNSASGPSNLRVAFRKAGVEEAVQTISTVAGSGWQMATFALDSKSANPELALIVSGTLNAAITSPSVIREGANMDFDTADKRYSWRNDNTGGRALILPDGVGGTSSTASWAAYAVPSATRAAGTDWPLRNRQLAIVPGTGYQICFDVKQTAAYSSTDSANRAMRVLSAGTEVVRASFRPTTAGWTHVCSSVFTAPTPDNNMQLGFDGPTASAPFLVDNIQITPQCLPNPCGGAMCGSVSDGCGHTVSCGTCGFGTICSSGACTCKPRACLKGWWWNPDDCRCELGLPR